MRVTVVDPPAYTPPYDHALCAALAGRGLDVELVTSHFRYGGVPQPQGYHRTEGFYRVRPGSAAAKAVQHPLDMSRLARRLRRAPRGVVHFQWLPIPALDRWLVRAFPRPVVLTAHDVLPREARRGGGAGSSSLLRTVDAVVVHSEVGRSRLVAEAGVDPARINVIPHGAFEHLTGPASVTPPALEGLDGRRVVLFFGLVRPYKGVDLLVEAFPATPDDAVLLVVGMPRTPIAPLERRARELGIDERVRFVPRFVPDDELPSYFRRADVVALPYREIDQSGVLYTALAFGSPLLLSEVGGFPEIAARGAAQLVEPGNVESLRAGLIELLSDDGRRLAMGEAALRLARGEHSWAAVAEATERLYRLLLEDVA
jgi:glycosyltransferase involved in cell wall biosynthesis